MKIITFITFLLFTTFNYAKPHQHSLIGYHGMVVLYDKDIGLFVSHLPLYSAPHHYQLIYQISTPDSNLLINELTGEMITVLPAKFDLTTLVNKKQLTVSATFYRGHFERGGKPLVKSNLTFEKAILVEPVVADFKQEQAKFYQVPLAKHKSLVVHKIQQAPSFDAIGIIKNKLVINQCDHQVTSDYSALTQQLKQCGINKVLYLETQDFLR